MAYPTGALVAVDSAGYEIRTTKYALQTMTDVTPSLETLIAAVGPENAILDLSPPGPGPHNAPSAPPASPARGGVPGVREAGSEEPAALSPPSPCRRGAGGEVLEFAIAGRAPRVAL